MGTDSRGDLPSTCHVAVLSGSPRHGAGKTTLFRMITGQEQPDAGELQVGETVKVFTSINIAMTSMTAGVS